MSVPPELQPLPRFYDIPIPPTGTQRAAESGDPPEVNIVTPSMHLGGAERMAVELMRGLDERGYTVALHDASKGRPDVSRGRVTIWWGEVFRGAAPPGSIYVVHSPAPAVREAAERCASDIDLLVGVATGLGSVIVPNGTGPSADPTSPRRRVDSPDPLTVLFLGRYAPEKCPLMALEAVDQLPDHVRLRYHGTGPMRADIARAIEARGLAERVDLGGVVAAQDALQGADCLVVCSEYEGNPLAVIEAAHAGVPIIHCGQGDLAKMPGGVQAEHTADSIADAILGLVNEPEEAAKKADQSHWYARRLWTRDAMAERWDRVIRQWIADERTWCIRRMGDIASWLRWADDRR